MGKYFLFPLLVLKLLLIAIQNKFYWVLRNRTKKEKGQDLKLIYCTIVIV